MVYEQRRIFKIKTIVLGSISNQTTAIFLLFGLLDVQVDYELSTLILHAIVISYTVDFKQRLCFCYYSIVRRPSHGLVNHQLSVSCNTVVSVV